jgi:hypothetical protein
LRDIDLQSLGPASDASPVRGIFFNVQPAAQPDAVRLGFPRLSNIEQRPRVQSCKLRGESGLF